MKKDFIVTSESGIHARPATELVRVASMFKSDIKMTARDQTIDMKSIMGVMSLGMYGGQKFTLVVEGVDEEEAMEKITEQLRKAGLAKVDE
ncbi:MAG TPA: HPr family phosphocarrier protein [Acholeplasma sp.]|jgi:phosphocarrier protein HPr|nr:HPr family phosphocarrier protein [Acholeplasma sp.]